ncbi:MAG: hypothetical protein ACLGJA_25040, partial [Gammaproteobacteria bacterium]
MDSSVRRGSVEMMVAMLISGTIGWFVLVSGQPVLEVVFWRCVFGAPPNRREGPHSGPNPVHAGPTGTKLDL